jgi:hypothetical protein
VKRDKREPGKLEDIHTKEKNKIMLMHIVFKVKTVFEEALFAQLGTAKTTRRKEEKV